MVAESLDAEIDDMKGLPPAKYKFQKEHWQLRYLPYYSELEAQANRHFSEIKAGLAHSIALNDIRYGFDNWSRELAFYIHQYGLRFSKEEHVTLVKMYLCFIQKGSFWRQTKRIIRFLTQLLDKYHFLSREDLIIDWRPLYELYIEIAYKNLENKVYFNLPPNFKADLRNLIVRARRYFSSSATQELLDETRPLMCIWDDSSVRAWDILDLFLPMRFSSELHQIEGNSLWFEEAWHWYVLTEKKNGVDEHIVNLFDRLTYECPDSIDWTPKLDIIFTKIMRLLKLFSIDGAKGTIATSKYPEWIANLLGSRCHDAVMKHLKSILDMAEDLLHPSNHGSHSKNLLTFFKDFSERIICRISRESDEDSNILKFANKFPKEMRLTDQLLNELTKMFLPSLKLIIFTKVDQRLANEILRSFARFSPEMIIPMILEMIQSSIDSDTEPHRLIQPLVALLNLLPLYGKQPGEFGMSMIIQSISILKQLIPELNFNEYDKCEAVLNLMTRLFGMMILVDSSEAIHARSDLTEVERKLCIMTSSFEDMLNSFMDKMFTKFIDCGLSITPTDSYSGIAIKEKLCHEELTIHCTLIRIYRCICNNTGTAFHKTVTDRLFNFIAENIHENEQYSLTVTNLVLIAVRSSEKSCFSRFFNLIFDRLQSVLVPEVYIKEKIDFEVIWWLRMMSRAVRVSAATLLENWTDIRKLFELVIQQVWRCPEATQLTTLILESVLQGLTSIEFINLDRRAKFDQPFERYLPIRHWAFEFDKENYEFRWNVPTNESIQRATEVFRDFVMPHVEALNQPEGRDKKEIHHRLLVIRDFFDGACFSLPLLEGPIIPGTYDSHVHQWHETNIVRSSSIPEMSYNGCNIRQVLLDCVKNLLCHLLKQSKDDCKSIRTSIFILYEILYFRGFDKEKYKNAKKDYDNLKRISTFGTFSTKFDISFIVEHSIVLLHNRRISYNNMWNVKKQHVDVLNLLIEASTDEYSQVRSNAQKYVRQIWADFPHSYEKVLDKVVDYLNPSNNPTHEQMKGALHLLIDGGEASVLIVEDYRSMIKLWSTIIKMQCSDRQSIIKLFTDAYSTLSKNYSTVQIKFEVPDSVRKTAMQLLALNYGSPVNVKRSDLTDQQIGHYANHLEEIYDQMKRDYCELANHIVSTTQDSSLHWRHLGLASYMLELLLRKDEEFPEEGVKLYASQLTHDILEIRKTARARLSTWLGIIKKKSIKMDYTIPCKNPNLTTGAKWPIEYGIRDDNQWLIYEEDKLPQNEKEWNKTHVICKKHYGFYTWPDKLRRSPLEYQASLCRTLEELNPIELHIAKILTDPQFIDRMLQLFIHDTDEKNTNLFFLCFFCKIFRVFGYILLPYYKDKIETLLQSPKENIQALGIQITRTILIASKFWKWEQQQDLWQWIEPVLHTALVNINEDNLSKWVDSVREICMLLDPQQLKPLFDVLFSLVNRPADNPFAASARLMLVRKAVSKLKWRGLGLHRKIFDVIKKNPISQFTNQCDSIARTLTTITAFDIPSLFVSPNLPDSLKPIKTTEVIETYAELLKACWNEVRFDLNSCENLHESKRDEGATKANTCSESKKRSRLALKILALYVDKAVRKFHYSFRPEFVELIPLFAHFSSDLGDEELAMDCRLAIRAMSFMHIYENQQASQVIELFRKTSISHCWWKTKLWMIRRMRTLFISNFFVFKPHAHTICEILLAFLVDNQLEVRNASSDSLVDLIQSSLIEVTTVLIDKFTSFTNSDSTLTKHSGVLGLSAIVNAFPYTIPPFMPDILMTICKFATSPNPIQNEVKRTMAGFKKTHNDSWREHKEHFNEDQLLILRNLMVSPNYYV
ncbi:hypothetical protein WR25_09442 [Diploscapter pachys]|uniref:Proteasome activator complex subunit 4 C-terminal domain-containing protein n=1 Tax=Diploscapter pachys TaxID=2018661 RepID=A0A2A2K3Y9_9BILA|nr:hypothetical protein WR25_09442 [Diploscapter pachys]